MTLRALLCRSGIASGDFTTLNDWPAPKGLETFLPLPKGEGRGEGEDDI